MTANINSILDEFQFADQPSRPAQPTTSKPKTARTGIDSVLDDFQFADDLKPAIKPSRKAGVIDYAGDVAESILAPIGEILTGQFQNSNRKTSSFKNLPQDIQAELLRNEAENKKADAKLNSLFSGAIQQPQDGTPHNMMPGALDHVVGPIPKDARTYLPNEATWGDVAKDALDSYKSAMGKSAMGALGTITKGAPAWFGRDAKAIHNKAMAGYNQAEAEQNFAGQRYAPESAKSRVYGATSSVIQNALPIAATALTGNPGFALAPLTFQVATDRAGEMLDKGYDAGDAIAQGIMFGAAEALPERLSLGKLIDLTKAFPKVFGAGDAAARKAAARQIAISAIDYYGTEVGTENITALTQDIIRKFSDRPDITVGEIINNLKETTIQTAIAAPMMAGIGVAASQAGNMADKYGRKKQASEARERAFAKLGVSQPKQKAQPTDGRQVVNEIASAAQPKDAKPAPSSAIDSVLDQFQFADDNKPIPDRSPFIDDDVEQQAESAERYQWNANKDGGQEYGNQQVIQPLTKELFDAYLADKVRPELGTYEAYSAAHPDMSISLISQDHGATWTPEGVGTVDELRPRPSNPDWVKRVSSFDSQEAIDHGATPDSAIESVIDEQANDHIPDTTKKVATPDTGAQEKTPQYQNDKPKEAETADQFADRSRKAFLKLIKDSGGINLAESADITSEGGRGANRLLPGLFSRNGAQLDSVAELLHERGYISDEEYNGVDGGVQRVRDLVREALHKEFVGTPAQHDILEELRLAERVAQDQEAAAEAMDLFDMGGQVMTGQEAEAWLNEGDTNEDRGIEAQAETENAGRTEGDLRGSENLRADETARGEEFAPSNQHDAPQTGRSEEEGLTSYTNQDILDREKGPTQAEKDAEAKRRADQERDHFTLQAQEKPKSVQDQEAESKNKTAQADMFSSGKASPANGSGGKPGTPKAGMQERPTVRADKTGPSEEPAQSNGAAAGNAQPSPIQMKAQEAAIATANDELWRQSEYDIADELKRLQESGDGPDLSDMLNESRYWDAENEEFTDAGSAEVARRNDALARERAGAAQIEKLDELNDVNQTVQAEAFAAYADAYGLPTNKSYSTGGSRYVEVVINGESYKVRFADHFNTVSDSTMQPDFNVAPGRHSFMDAIAWIDGKVDTPVDNKRDEVVNSDTSKLDQSSELNQQTSPEAAPAAESSTSENADPKQTEQSNYGEKFTLDMGEFFGKIPYRASNQVNAPEGGEVLSSEIITKKIPIKKYDQEAYGLPKNVYAWRVSAISNKDGEIYSQVEAMIENHGRTPDGEVIAYFTPLKGHALDAVSRIAPAIYKVAVRAYEQAVAEQNQGDVFKQAPQSLQSADLESGLNKLQQDGELSTAESLAVLKEGLRKQQESADQYGGGLPINGILSGGIIPNRLLDQAVEEVGGGGKAYKRAAEMRIAELESESKSAEPKPDTKQTDKGVAMFSRADRTNIDTATRRMSKFVDEFVAGRLKPTDTQSIGDTPTVLQALGAENLPLQIDGATVNKVLGGKHKYFITPDMLKSIPEHLYDPLAVFDSPTKNGEPGKVLLTELTDSVNGKPVIVAIHLSKESGRFVFNDVASIYGADDYSQSNKLTPELIEYYRNEKSLEQATTNGLNIPLADVVQSAQDLGKILLKESDVVNQYGEGYSRNEGEVTNPHTITTLKSAMDVAWGNGFAKRLEGTGRVAFITSEQIPGDVMAEATVAEVQSGIIDPAKISGGSSLDKNIVKWLASVNSETDTDIRYSADGSRILAFVLDGKITFVADNISQTDDDVKGLTLHEIGVHALQLGKTDKGFQSLLRQFEAMKKSGNAKVKAAFDRVPSDTAAELVTEEALGYYLEANPNQSLAQKFFAWFRNAIRNLAGKLKGADRLRFVQWANKLTENDLIYLANAVTRQAAERLQNQNARQGEFRSDVPGWYFSQLAKAFKDAKQESMPAQQWKLWLQSNKAKMGVKDDEIQWTGINDYLELRGKEKVTKAEINEYLKNNGVQVTENVLGNNLFTGYTVSEYSPDSQEWSGESSLFNTRKDAEQYVEIRKRFAPKNTEFEITEHEGQTNTKFDQFKIPGGENYREFVLTIPNDDYESPHFPGIKGYIAHVRANERIDADGKRVWFIEENQSDRGQEGRKEGIKGKLPDGYVVTELQNGDWIVKNPQGAMIAHSFGRKGDDGKRTAIDNALKDIAGSIHAVPDAPFIGKTDAWVALSLKRMIRYAAENGFDRIAWTTGEQQAERYDLSKQVEAISWQKFGVWNKAGDLSGEKYRLFVYPKTGTQIEREVFASDMPDFIGKEATDRILESGKPNGELRGLDLKVGGEGMKGFYDNIVPQVANELLRKLGGGKVVPVRMETVTDEKFEQSLDAAADRGEQITVDSEAYNALRFESQPGFDITPELRAKALAGMPLFSKIPGLSSIQTLIRAWRTIGSDMAVYQNPTPDSFDMAESAREIDPGMQAIEDKPDEDERRDAKIERKWSVKMPDGTIAKVYENNKNEIWINAANLAEGVSGGNKLYLLVGSYAEANGKVFIGDPAGLSDVALIRRTENMLSLALRYGKTDFMQPHEYQMNPDEKLDSVLKDVVRPINWVVGDDQNNLGELLKTSYSNTVNLFPEIKNVTYNFEAGRFEHDDGRALGDEYFNGLARGLGDSLRQRGFGRILGHAVGNAGGNGKSPAQRAPIGSATLKRAAITNTVARAAGSGSGRELLDGIGSVVSRGLKDTPLRKILYSKKQPRQSSLNIAGQSSPPTPPTQIPLGLANGANGNNASWDSPEPGHLDNLIYRLQDKHIDLKRVQQAIKETSGALRDAVNAYQKEELYHGRAAERVDLFLENELEPLIEQMRVEKVSQDELNDYLWARHAEEANDYIASINPNMPDGGSGMTTQEARDYLNALPADKRQSLDNLANMVDAITANTRQTLVSYGLMSVNDKTVWEDTYKHYIPLNREDMDTLGHGNGTGQGYSIRGPESKRRTGSTRDVVDILGNIANQREKAIVRGEKNRVAMALYGLAKENKNHEFWKTDTPPKIRVVENIDGNDTVIERIDPAYKSRENVVMVKLPDGKGGVVERSIVFNEHNERAMRMARSIKNLDGAELGEFLGTAAKITRYFASINTQYNPIFGVVNATRDVQGALFNLSTTPLAGKQKKILLDTASILAGAAKHGFRGYDGKWDALAHEFRLMGGQTGYREMFRTGKDRSEAIEKALDPSWWTKTLWGKTLTANGYLEKPGVLMVENGVRPVLDWLSDYNTVMENAVRLAAYAEARKIGLSKERSASIAKNLTVNFNRKGELGTQIGSLYAFFNATVQGTARMVETMKGPAGKRIIAGGVMLGAMQAIMLAVAGFDEDEPPDFVRERNLILPIGGKKYLTLPMPLGLHVIPNIGRIAVETMIYGKPMERGFQMLGVMADAFNPLGGSAPLPQIVMPTAADPLVAIATNTDWTGKPIARENRSTLAPTPGFERAKDAAGMPSRWVAKAINAMTGGNDYVPGLMSPTPDQIEYLVGQVTGGIGREVMKAGTTASAMVTGEELPSYKIPLIGRFYGTSEGQAPQGNRFYAKLKEINEHEAMIRGLKRDGRAKELESYIKANPDAKLIGLANDYEAAVRRLRKHKSELIDKGADREKVRQIDTKITETMRKFNDRVESVQK